MLTHIKYSYTYNYIYIYCTVKNICGEKLWRIWRITAFHQAFLPIFTISIVHISYANGLQFAKVFPAKLPTVLICQSFLLSKFFIIQYPARI